MKEGKKKSKKKSPKKIKQVNEMITASATTLRNVHANCGTEDLLAHRTGRPLVSQTPHGHLGLPAATLQSCPTSSVTGTTWLACHLASLVREKASPWQGSLHHSPQLPSSHLGLGDYHGASPRVLSLLALPGRQQHGHLL